MCLVNIGPREVRKRLLAGLVVLAACAAAAVPFARGNGPPALALAFLPLSFFAFLALGQARAKL